MSGAVPAATPQLAATPGHAGSGRVLGICGLAVVNYGLFYAVNVVLARTIGAAEFGKYWVAVSAVTVLAAFATLGLEKYALRSLPAYHQREDWARTNGFWRFSLVTIIVVGLTLATATLGATILYEQFAGDRPRHALESLIWFLPVVGLTLFMIEVVTANDGCMRATVAYRVILPGCVLGLVLAGRWLLPGMASEAAAIAYGLAWVVALVVSSLMVAQTMPRQVWGAAPAFRPRHWLDRSAAYMINSLLLTVMANSGVLVLSVLHHSTTVGIYSAVAQTGAMVILVATSTNRFYCPRLSILLERGDHDSMLRVLRQRRLITGALALGFTIVIALLGRPILRLYGEQFTGAYTALVIVAGASAFNTYSAVAPYVLQFLGRQRLAVGLTAATVTANVGLTFLLASRYDVLGAAIGYAAPVIVFFAAFNVFARREINRALPAG